MFVPARSERDFIFDEAELTCDDPRMQSLYDGIVAILSNRIIQHRILDDDRLLFELLLDSGRTQVVICAQFYDSLLEADQLLIWSEVGTIVDGESAEVALHIGSQYPHLNVHLNEDDLLAVNSVVELNESASRLWTYLLLTAVAADVLEQELFSWDLV